MARLMGVLAILTAICAISLSHPGAEERVESLIKIAIAEREELRTFMEMGITITDRSDTYVKAIVTEDQLEKLTHRGYEIEMITPDLAREIDSLKALPDRAEYHSYSELIQDLTALVDSYPSITELDTIGLSVDGRAIVALKITDNPAVRENEPEVRIVGAHHGNEIISVEVPLILAHELCGGYGTDPELTYLVDNRETWIIPMLNPDGVEYGRRGNANWVDLNRDYGYIWEGHGGSPAPYSQPETQALYLFSQEHNFSLSLSHHSGAVYVNYLWNYTPIRTQDDSLIVELSDAYGDFSGYPVTNGWEWYETHGDCNDYSYGIDGDMDWTIEISSSYAPPASQIDYYYGLNRDAQLYIIKKAGQGIGGYVTDAVTGDTLKQARVNVLEIDWPVFADPFHGDYHRVLLPGTYTLRASANGYLPQTISDIDVFEDSTTEANFSLQPGGSWYAHKFVEATITDPADAYNNETLTPHALGAPDGDFASIGVGGSVILDMGFLTPVADTVGPDFTIYEGDDGEDEEGYTVYVSENWNGPWENVGTGEGSQSFDINPTGLSQIRYIRIVDDGDGSSTDPYAGFDLEAIEGKPLSGPNLAVDSLEVDDFSGNGDGILEPGETANLYFALVNEGVDSAQAVEGRLVELTNYLVLSDSLGEFGDIAPGQTAMNSSDPFTITAEASTPWHQAVEFVLIVEDDGGYSDSLFFGFIVGSGGDFLVVDLDPNHSSGPVLKAVLDSLGYRGTYGTALSDYFSELDDYRSIMICLGIYGATEQIANGSPEAESLESYLLDDGGNLYIEGGDVWYYAPRHGGYDFGPLFGIFASLNGLGDLSTVDGQPGTFSGGFSSPYNGENESIDRILPVDSGFAVFSNSSPYYTCGVANLPGDYRTLGVCFEFGGLSDESERFSLADSIMHFFGIFTNYPPGHFSLLTPPSGDTVSLPTLLDWQDSHDPDLGDTLLYRLMISLSPTFHPDSTIAIDSLAGSDYTLESIPLLSGRTPDERRETDTVRGKNRGNQRSLMPATGGDEKFFASYFWKVLAFDDSGQETESDQSFALHLLTESLFVRGDVNADERLSMDDAIFLLRYLYVPGNPSPPCMDGADSDDTGETTMGDAMYLLKYLYVPGAPTPPEPFPDCGSDPTPDGLECESHPCMTSKG